MNSNANNRNDQGNQNGKQNQKTNTAPDKSLPYYDPAMVNPEELASFPKKSKITAAKEVENERESHLVNKRTPVREGRNITRTDNNPDSNGFM